MAGNQRARRPYADDRTREVRYAPIPPHIARGIEIAKRPVGEWRALVAELPDSDREPVREYLREVHAVMKQHAQADVDLASGRDVVLTLKAGGVKEARWA